MQAPVRQSGWLFKRGEVRKSIKKRWCVVDEKGLHYFKGNPNIKRDPELGLVDASLIENVQDGQRQLKKEHCIIVITRTRTWYFWADDAADQKRWINALEDVMTSGLLKTPVVASKRTESKNKEETEFKVVFLGNANAGKTTLLKQVKIGFSGGFSEDRRMEYRPVIWENVLTSALTIGAAADKFGFHFSSDAQSAMNKIRSVAKADADTLKLIIVMWEDAAFLKAFDRRSEYELSDSTVYFKDRLVQLADNSYCPTEQDVLRARQKTRGRRDLPFEFEGMRYRFYDVGGQREERKKHWSSMSKGHVDRSFIVFVVSLSSYNELVCVKDNVYVNAMDESLSIFKDLVNDAEFGKKTMYVLFNKMDLFEEKVKSVDLTVCPSFSDYKGKQDVESCLKHIQDVFKAIRPEQTRIICTAVSPPTAQKVFAGILYDARLCATETTI
jgi:GTPase SAR1 family protein